MNPKKRENQNVNASVLLRRVNKLLTGGNIQAKCGSETEGKAIKRLTYLGYIPYRGVQRDLRAQVGPPLLLRGTCPEDSGRNPLVSVSSWGPSSATEYHSHVVS